MTVPQLRLQVRVPDPSQTGFRLDVTPLDSLQPLNEAPGAFVLDVHRLAPAADAGVLAPAATALVWVDLYPWCTSISASHGHRPDAGLPATPGTLTANLKNAPDLGALGVVPGTPVRLATATDVLWWGWAENDNDRWTPGAGEDVRKLTTFTAIDAHAMLGNVTRYGVRLPDPEPLTPRVTRLLASSPLTIYADDWQKITHWDSNGQPITELVGHCEPTVMETNLLKHITMAANSCGAAATVEPPIYAALQNTFSGNVRFHSLTQPGNLTDGLSWLTDDWDAPSPGPSSWTPVSYYDISVSTPDPLLSALDITNHQIGADGNALDTRVTVTDPTAEAMFGRRATGIDLTADPNGLEHIGQELLAAHREDPARPSSVTIDGDDVNHGYRLLWQRLAIQRLGRTWWMTVVHVRHTITPAPALDGHRRHRITLDLYPSPLND